MPRVIDAFTQFFDDTGAPLIDGWLKFTVSGTNNTDKDTYADVSEVTPNANPVQLSAAGRCPDVFGSGSYRVTSYTNDPINDLPDVQVQQFDPVGGDSGASNFDAWNSESIYSITDIVQGSDDNYYASLTSANQGNDPISDAVNWEQVELVSYWNTNKTYSEHDKVRLLDGTRFISRTDSNTGNAPETDSTNWQSEDIRAWTNTKEFGLAEITRDDETGAFWVSLVATNSGNDPLADDGTNWAPATSPLAIPYTGGGTLVAYQICELQDGSTYTLPDADSVPAGGWVLCEQPDIYSDYTPTVQRAGADTVTDKDGADTAVLFNAGQSSIVRFVTDGISDWRV